MFNLQGKDPDKYFKEVEDKLIEKPIIYWNQTKPRRLRCVKIENLFSLSYYPEYSSEKIITMD
jgi:hypothetical protein